MAKPKITIKNFTGMSDDGMYYLEGMSARKLQGQGILTPSWNQTLQYSEDTSGFTGMTKLKGADSMEIPSSESIFGIDNDGNIIHFASGQTSYGVIHNIVTESRNPDIIRTANNNLLYTSAQHLGIGRTFVATGGSTTTIVVSGEDFTANYDYTDGDKLYNFTNGEEYEIDTGGVGTTTLTLVTGTACASGNKFIVFNDDFQDLVETSSSQIRQIKLIDHEYYITANDYMASLNDDESTFSATAKELPNGMEAVCQEINQDKILIGADINGRGALLLWDATSDDWNSILYVDKAPGSIVAYNSGWVIVVGGRLYYTDGYQIKLVSRYPDTYYFDRSLNVIYNGMTVLDDKVMLGIDIARYNRQQEGVAIYDFAYGWSFCPFTNSSNDDKFPMDSLNVGMVKAIYANNTNYVYTSFSADEGTKLNCINRLNEGGSSEEYSALLYVKLPNKMRINTIELNLASKYDETGVGSITADPTVTVNYGDARRPLYYSGQVGTSSTTAIVNNGNGATNPAVVGQQIRILKSDIAGERRYIDTIANSGEATEAWTLDTVLSDTPTEGSTLLRTNLYKAETKTITNLYIPDNLTFNVSNFYSDKLYIEVVVNGGVLDIHNINIY